MNQQGHLIPNAIPGRVAPVASNDYIRLYRHKDTRRYYGLKYDGTSELINGATTPFSLTSGSANNYTYIHLDVIEPAYHGQILNVMFNANSTGASTINVNGAGSVPLLKQDGQPIASGDIKSGYVYSIIYIVGDGNYYNFISTI